MPRHPLLTQKYSEMSAPAAPVTEAIEVEPQDLREAPDVEAAPAPAAPAEPETTNEDKCRLKLWAGASVLGIIASAALLVVDTVYIKLPYAAAAVFLALLMPGLLLSLHVLLQDVDLGKEDLMRAAGDTDESCGFTSVLRSWVKAMAASAALLVVVALFSTAWLAAVAARDTSAVVVWAVAPLFAAAILLGVLFFFAHRAGRRAVNDLDFKLEHPTTAAVQVVAPPPPQM